jgi:hypothetical protein
MIWFPFGFWNTVIAPMLATLPLCPVNANDEKAASVLPRDLAGKTVTVLDCRTEDLLEVVEIFSGDQIIRK